MVFSHFYAFFLFFKAVKKLSNFVAVVDEEDSDVSYEDLEKLLHSVGERFLLLF